MKQSIHSLNQKRVSSEPISWLTCYDYSFAAALNDSALDMILVGDSGAMVLLGYPDTVPVSMDEMIILSAAVRRGAPNKFIVGDMPKGSYETSDYEAVTNAMRFVKEAQCDAIKVGRDNEELKRLHNSVKELENAGVFGILIEAIPPQSAKKLAESANTIIFGIGAGKFTHGQLLILHDLLGLYPNFRPKFAKNYIPAVVSQFLTRINSEQDLIAYGRATRKDGLYELTRLAVEAYVSEVKLRLFPNEAYSYKD